MDVLSTLTPREEKVRPFGLDDGQAPDLEEVGKGIPTSPGKTDPPD